MRQAAAPPFVLEQRTLDLQNDGTFTPNSAVLLTSALLESGLLLDLTPTELQTLLSVLCCVTSNGGFVATADALAQRLRLWPGQMRARLEKLMTRRWDGQPLLRCQATETGLRLFSPSPALFEVRRVLVFPETAQSGVALERPAALQQDGARVVGGLREAVVEHSRATYGRPRAEVEAEINRFLGSERNSTTVWPGPSAQILPVGEGEGETTETAEPAPEDLAKREKGRRLIDTGLTSEQARFLVDAYPLELIDRQMEYLPFRQARNPAGMLVASIEGDYAPPLAFRHATPQSASMAEGDHEAAARQLSERESDPKASTESGDEIPPLESKVQGVDLPESTSFEGYA